MRFCKQQEPHLREWVLILPRLPISQNDDEWRQRWSQYSYKRAWKEEVYWLCKEQQIPELKQVAISVVIYFPDRRKRDLDNYHPTTCKATQDGLTFAGVIPTDDERYIPEIPGLRFEYDKDKPRTEITIMEIAA